jgi:lycopene beta-cyclase
VTVPDPDHDTDVDVAIVGAGGAGLSLVLHLDALLRQNPQLSAPTIALVDPVHRAGDDRTWCFWDDHAAANDPVEPVIHRSWTRADLVTPRGERRLLELAPLRYAMVLSSEFYAHAEQAVQRLGVRRITAAADLIDGPDRVLVRPTGGREHPVAAGRATGALRARWVFDSRPTPPARPGASALLLHFRGWTVRFPEPVLDPQVPTLMDFSTPQPSNGVSFGYCLPLAADRGLVEYNEFSPSRLPDSDYDRAMRALLAGSYGPAGRAVTIEAVEDGALPMTDARFDRRAGRRVFRIGTAGGATRGSTGYAFAAIQRQSAVVAEALLAGREPLPPAAYPARHRWMDAVLLRVLDRGLTDRAELFVRLFERNPPQRLLRFLDGDTGFGEELALMASSPPWPMIRAAGQDALWRLTPPRLTVPA